MAGLNLVPVMKKVEDSAKHKKRVQELHERFGVPERFQQQDNVGGYAKFASPQFASPPIQRGSRGFAGSPVHMASLNAEDDTRSPFELKKVL